MKKNYFSYRRFYVLAHISVPLLVLVTLRLISAHSGSFEETQKSKMADPRRPPFHNYDVITRHIASTICVTDIKGNIFGRTIYPLSLTILLLISTRRTESLQRINQKQVC